MRNRKTIAKQHIDFDSHTDVLFKEHGILKFFVIYFYQIGKFMYLFKKGLLHTVKPVYNGHPWEMAR